VPTGPRPPIPPGFAKLVLSGTVLSKPWRNIAYLALGGSGIGTADLNTLCGTIDTAWGTRFIANLSDQTLLTQVQLVYIPSVGAEIVGNSTVTKTGTRVGGFVADASAAFLLNWNVNKYYRGGHPRWYLPGVCTADVTNGSVIGGSIRTALAVSGNGLLNDINAATTTNITSAQLGTLSFQHANAWRTPPVFWPFSTCVVAGLLATQRRRIRA
jgi:hypothetical protein